MYVDVYTTAPESLANYVVAGPGKTACQEHYENTNLNFWKCSQFSCAEVHVSSCETDDYYMLFVVFTCHAL